MQKHSNLFITTLKNIGIYRKVLYFCIQLSYILTFHTRFFNFFYNFDLKFFFAKNFQPLLTYKLLRFKAVILSLGLLLLKKHLFLVCLFLKYTRLADILLVFFQSYLGFSILTFANKKLLSTINYKQKLTLVCIDPVGSNFVVLIDN